MARVKGGLSTKKRRKRVLKLAKGYRGAKSKLYRTANEAVMKSLTYAYIGRKQKKRDFRRLWITRISAACKMNDINYSRFMNGLKKAGIDAHLPDTRQRAARHLPAHLPDTRQLSRATRARSSDS